MFPRQILRSVQQGPSDLAGFVLLYPLFHPEMEEDEDRSLAEKVQEHVRKILEPKFDIESVDPESKQSARTSEKEEKKEEKKGH